MSKLSRSVESEDPLQPGKKGTRSTKKNVSTGAKRTSARTRKVSEDFEDSDRNRGPRLGLSVSGVRRRPTQWHKTPRKTTRLPCRTPESVCWRKGVHLRSIPERKFMRGDADIKAAKKTSKSSMDTHGSCM